MKDAWHGSSDEDNLDLMSSGSHRYALTSATGVYLLARVEEKGTVLHISSFSPRISLPDDSIPPERF